VEMFGKYFANKWKSQRFVKISNKMSEISNIIYPQS